MNVSPISQEATSNGAHKYRTPTPEVTCKDTVVVNGDCCNPRPKPKLKVGLIYSSLERLRLKDFNSEVRAAIDVEQFLHQAELILDMSEVSVEDIVDAMLIKVS